MTNVVIQNFKKEDFCLLICDSIQRDVHWNYRGSCFLQGRWWRQYIPAKHLYTYIRVHDTCVLIWNRMTQFYTYPGAWHISTLASEWMTHLYTFIRLHDIQEHNSVHSYSYGSLKSQQSTFRENCSVWCINRQWNQKFKGPGINIMFSISCSIIMTLSILEFWSKLHKIQQFENCPATVVASAAVCVCARACACVRECMSKWVIGKSTFWSPVGHYWQSNI